MVNALQIAVFALMIITQASLAANTDRHTQLREALSLLTRSPSQEHDAILTRAVELLVHRGDFDGAKVSLAMMHNKHQAGIAASLIAKAQLKTGKFERATIAEFLRAAGHAPTGSLEYADLLRASGLYEAAIQEYYANSISPPMECFACCESIQEMVARIRAERKAVPEIDWTPTERIGIVLADVDRHADIVRLYDQICDNPEDADSELRRLAVLFMDRNRPLDVTRLCQTLPQHRKRSVASVIALCEPIASDYRQYVETTDIRLECMFRISDPRCRTIQSLWLASIEADRGSVANARQLLKEAEDAWLSLKDTARLLGVVSEDECAMCLRYACVAAKIPELTASLKSIERLRRSRRRDDYALAAIEIGRYFNNKGICQNGIKSDAAYVACGSDTIQACLLLGSVVGAEAGPWSTMADRVGLDRRIVIANNYQPELVRNPGGNHSCSALEVVGIVLPESATRSIFEAAVAANAPDSTILCMLRNFDSSSLSTPELRLCSFERVPFIQFRAADLLALAGAPERLNALVELYSESTDLNLRYASMYYAHQYRLSLHQNRYDAGRVTKGDDVDIQFFCSRLPNGNVEGFERAPGNVELLRNVFEKSSNTLVRSMAVTDVATKAVTDSAFGELWESVRQSGDELAVLIALSNTGRDFDVLLAKSRADIVRLAESGNSAYIREKASFLAGTLPAP